VSWNNGRGRRYELGILARGQELFEDGKVVYTLPDEYKLIIGAAAVAGTQTKDQEYHVLSLTVEPSLIQLLITLNRHYGMSQVPHNWGRYLGVVHPAITYRRVRKGEVLESRDFVLYEGHPYDLAQGFFFSYDGLTAVTIASYDPNYTPPKGYIDPVYLDFYGPSGYPAWRISKVCTFSVDPSRPSVQTERVYPVADPSATKRTWVYPMAVDYNEQGLQIFEYEARGELSSSLVWLKSYQQADGRWYTPSRVTGHVQEELHFKLNGVDEFTTAYTTGYVETQLTHIKAAYEEFPPTGSDAAVELLDLRRLLYAVHKLKPYVARSSSGPHFPDSTLVTAWADVPMQSSDIVARKTTKKGAPDGNIRVPFTFSAPVYLGPDVETVSQMDRHGNLLVLYKLPTDASNAIEYSVIAMEPTGRVPSVEAINVLKGSSISAI